MIFIDPANITAGVGEQFNISVRLDNVTGLYGLDLTFRWGAEVLDYVSHHVTVPVETYPNGVLHEPTFTLTNNVSRANTLGIYELSVTSLGPKSFNGSGTIFNMTFQVLMEGECYFYVQDSELSDKSADPIDHETVDGYFYWPGLGEVPIADFTVTPDVASTPEPDIIANKTATFNASASRDPDGGNIVLYIWDFGDGTVNRTADPIINHTYPSRVTMPFDVFVELSVLDDQGGGSQSKAKRQKLQVILPDPVADFEFWPGTAPGTVLGPAVINNTVQFNASASYDPDPGGLVINYTWNFDDGSLIMVTNDTIVTHNYTSLPALDDEMGKYYFVKLKVYDRENLVSIETKKKVYLVSRRDVEVMDVTVSPSEFLQGED
ncbi:MAG: PKD domain-containing protein, partial [Candidatus Bathyarchaeota archaeon]|nr:PKD domain-containing protein [Candidatus Bathyarchaeota archaeon]